MSPQAYGLTKAAYDLPGLTAVISIGRSKLYEEMQRGALRVTKCGKRTLFLAPDVAAYLDILRGGDPTADLTLRRWAHPSAPSAGVGRAAT